MLKAVPVLLILPHILLCLCIICCYFSEFIHWLKTIRNKAVMLLSLMLYGASMTRNHIYCTFDSTFALLRPLRSSFCMLVNIGEVKLAS